MKKIIYIITFLMLMLITACGYSSLEGKTFVYDSWSFKEGQDLSDLDDEAVAEAEENIFAGFKFEFTENEVIFYDGIDQLDKFSYIYENGKLEIAEDEVSSNIELYMKGKKLYCEGKIDGFDIIVVLKVSE